ncbi:MAG: formylglycine-generating enzyme family protein [Candidatus Zhuqueibacterota bacterium]
MQRTRIILILSALLGLLSAVTAQNYSPIIDTVKVQQRDNSFLVDIYYDVIDTEYDSLIVFIHVSEDSGATFNVPVNALSGDFGYQIYPGTDRHIVWDAGKDYPEKFGKKFKVKLTASDTKLNHGEAIPPGGFYMGDSAGFDDPRHLIALDDFEVSRYEVTNAEYRLFCEMTDREFPPEGGLFQPPKGYFLEYKNYPVVAVSWYDAVLYCNWLSELQGLEQCYNTVNWVFDETKNGYHLPTEAQWEKAARGGLEKMLYPWGDDHPPETRANYQNYAGDLITLMANFDGQGRGTLMVDTLTTNGLGLYQMAGNVWEWCNDWYNDEYYYDSPDENPLGPTSGSDRVIRGGAWNTSDIYLHCAARDMKAPDRKRYDIGFRVAR